MLLLLLVLPAALAWDPAEGDVPWQPDEIALFELVSSSIQWITYIHTSLCILLSFVLSFYI